MSPPGTSRLEFTIRQARGCGMVACGTRAGAGGAANIVVCDRAHLGFRAIGKTASIRFLSGVTWAEYPGDEMAILVASRMTPVRRFR
jgi:hypothetical protein